MIAEIASAVGLWAALRVARKRDCCSWGEVRLNPLALVGVAYYLALLAALAYRPDLAPALALAGVVASLFLTLAQIVTGRYCGWCLLSAACALVALLGLV